MWCQAVKTFKDQKERKKGWTGEKQLLALHKGESEKSIFLALHNYQWHQASLLLNFTHYPLPCKLACNFQAFTLFYTTTVQVYLH